jgi:GWxTD domain-containing protein
MTSRNCRKPSTGCDSPRPGSGLGKSFAESGARSGLLGLAMLLVLAAAGSGATAGSGREERLARVDRLEKLGAYAEALDILEDIGPPDDASRRPFDLRRARLYRLLATPETRLQSAFLLERLLREDPADPRANFEMGLTRFEQTFYGEAASYFRKALKADSTHARSRLYLGKLSFKKWKKMPGDMMELEKSRRHFALAVRDDPGSAEAIYRLAVCQYFLKNYEEALGSLRDLVELEPRDAEGHLLLGVVYNDLGDLDSAQVHYDRGIAYLSRENRRPYRDITIFLGEDEREEFFDMDPIQQRETRRMFWAVKDPTPLSRANERLLTHYRRCTQADLLYSLPHLGLRGWETHRGQVFIKYGPPVRQTYDLGGGLSGPMWLWVYQDERGEPFHFLFMDEFLNGNFQFPIMDADPSSDYRNLRDHRELYRFASNTLHFPMVQDEAQFNGVEGKTRIEFYSAIPAEHRPTENVSIDLAEILPLTGTLVIYDPKWREVKRRAWNVKPSDLASFQVGDGEYGITAVNFDLAPGRYRYVVHYSDSTAKASGFVRGDLTVEAFDAFDLMLSEIEMAAEVRHEEGSSHFQKGPLHVVPNPLVRYHRSDPLSFYFEIYNLMPDSTGVTHFRATYSVTTPRALHPERHFDFLRQFKDTWARLRGRTYTESPYISGTITQTRLYRRSQEYLSLDLSDLDPGEYTLLLEVEDLESFSLARREKTFELVE